MIPVKGKAVPLVTCSEVRNAPRELLNICSSHSQLFFVFFLATACNVYVSQKKKAKNKPRAC